MLSTLLGTTTAKAVAAAVAAATLGGLGIATAVTLPDEADGRAGEAVESSPAGDVEIVEQGEGVEEQGNGEGEVGAESHGDAPEGTFGARVHELQEEFPDGGAEFGEAVSTEAQDLGAEQRETHVPEEHQANIPEDAGSQAEVQGDNAEHADDAQTSGDDAATAGAGNADDNPGTAHRPGAED